MKKEEANFLLAAWQDTLSPCGSGLFIFVNISSCRKTFEYGRLLPIITQKKSIFSLKQKAKSCNALEMFEKQVGFKLAFILLDHYEYKWCRICISSRDACMRKAYFSAFIVSLLFNHRLVLDIESIANM